MSAVPRSGVASVRAGAVTGRAGRQANAQNQATGATLDGAGPLGLVNRGVDADFSAERGNLVPGMAAGPGADIASFDRAPMDWTSPDPRDDEMQTLFALQRNKQLGDGTVGGVRQYTGELARYLGDKRALAVGKSRRSSYFGVEAGHL